MTDDEQRNPLGVLGVITWANEKNSPRKQMTRVQQTLLSRSIPRELRNSSRWESLAYAVHDALPAGVNAVHVMDQEADDFTLFCELLVGGAQFVIRGSGTRLTAFARESVAAVFEGARGHLFRRVTLNPRAVRKARGKGRPARAERDAHLSIEWALVEIARPDHVSSEQPRTLPLTVVHVYESKPPKGEEPVEWFLFTNTVVESLDDAARVVDHYRARWVIEEYFKALKTGCAIEERQLTTFDGLNRILGVLMPIAWRLLVLRQLGREAKPKPASAVMNEDQLALLRLLLTKRRHDHKLPQQPTVRDVMLAIAALGGHIRNNGDPGWIVLGRGFQVFIDAEVIWAEAQK